MRRVSPHGDELSAGFWPVGCAAPRLTPPPRAARGERWPTLIGLALLILLPSVAPAQSAGPVVGFQKWRLAAGQHDLDARLSAFALEAGRISSVANGRLLSAGARWETNLWANHQALITTGPGAGLLYAVQGNTEEHMQVAPDPLTDGVVLVGARFEILPNVEDDFGTQLAAGDGVGLAVAAPIPNRGGGTNGQKVVCKDAAGDWRDSEGNPATLPLLPGQRHRLSPAADREVVVSGRILWPSEQP